MKEGFLKCDENDIRNNIYRNRDGIYIKKAKCGQNVCWSNLEKSTDGAANKTNCGKNYEYT